MVTISESKKPKFRVYASAQMQYAITFLVITLIVLVFLNLYCAQVNEQLFRQSKRSSLLDKAYLTANEIAATGHVTLSSATSVALRTKMQLTRMVITNEKGNILYDSAHSPETQAPLSAEIQEALKGRSPFTWYYRKGEMRAAVAVPIYIDYTLKGTVYVLEVDTSDLARSRIFPCFL